MRSDGISGGRTGYSPTGYDHELVADFKGEERFVLPKPVQDPDLDRILRFLEPTATISHARTA